MTPRLKLLLSKIRTRIGAGEDQEKVLSSYRLTEAEAREIIAALAGEETPCIC